MFVLGVGAAYPEVEVSDHFLASIGLAPSKSERDLLARAGTRSRRTTLPLEYIKTTRNVKALQAREVALASPTALGELAARQALERAGVAVEQIGLVIADCSTPLQSCPSEAQRIAGGLGLKVPAYDVVAGESALLMFLNMLSTWKPERVPDFVLCVSTNTPTQHVAYAEQALPAFLYGDAAAAFVLSPRHQGKLKLGGSFLKRDGALKASSVVGRHLSFSYEALLSQDKVASVVSEGLKALAASQAHSIIGPQLYSGDFEALEKICGLKHGAMASGAADVGYSLGASSGVALARIWDTLRSDSSVAMVHVGDGTTGGCVLLGS